VGAVGDGKHVSELAGLELVEGVVDLGSPLRADSAMKPMSPPFEALFGSSEKFMATAPKSSPLSRRL